MENDTRQMTIFDYPNHAGAVRHSETSKAAAEAIEPVRETIAAKVLKYVAMREDGATSSEVCVGLNIRINTVTARLAELQVTGAVKDSGLTRPCPSSGHAKTVYVATGQEPGKKPKTLTRAQQARLGAMLEVRGEIVKMNAAKHGFATLYDILAFIDKKVGQIERETNV